MFGYVYLHLIFSLEKEKIIKWQLNISFDFVMVIEVLWAPLESRVD